MSATPDYDDRFRHLYLNHGEDLRAYCRRRLGREDADDALAEVFALAWRRFDKIPEGQEARLWLYGVARNVVRSATRTTRGTARLSSRLTASSEAPRSGPLSRCEITSTMGTFRTEWVETLGIGLGEDGGISLLFTEPLDVDPIDRDHHGASSSSSRASTVGCRRPTLASSSVWSVREHRARSTVSRRRWTLTSSTS